MHSDHTTRPPQRTFTEEQESEICRRYNTRQPNGDLPTAIELAAEYGCSDYVIRSIVRRNGIEVRHNKGRQSARMFDKATELAICEYYWTRLPTGYYPSYDEAGEAFCCSGNQVAVLLKRHGYESRSNAETRESRPCRPINKPTGPTPLCACGCGQLLPPPEYVSHQRQYIRGHQFPKSVYHDPEWLKREYYEKNRTQSEIAAQFNVAPGTIGRIMKKLGMEIRDASETLVTRGSVSGSNNPAWKGGVAKWAYSPDWKRLCKQIKDRDKWTCQLCNEQRKRWGHRLHVHHIDEDKTNNHPHNLISLCSTCHAPIHGTESIRAKLVAIAIANTA